MNYLTFLADAAAEANKYDAAGHLYIAIGIIMIAMSVSSFGEAWLVSKAIEGMARNPEASGTLRTSMVLGTSLVETVAIYGLVLSILLIFVGPGYLLKA